MIICNYQLKNGQSMGIAIDERKKPLLMICEDDGCFRKVASFDSHDSVRLFCKAFSAFPPSWVGMTYQEALNEERAKWPFLNKGGQP